MNPCHRQLQMLKSRTVPANTLTPKQQTWPSMDSDLIRVLSKAVEDLGLDWSAPDEPAHGHFDEWYLQGHH